MSEYKQDKNAGNIGDYLKHLLLIKLIEKVIKEYPGRSIAYIESHAGAGLYNLEESHYIKRDEYRKLVCEDDKQWDTFDGINPLKNKEYFGSFMLVRKILEKNNERKSTFVLYEKLGEVVKRAEKHTSEKILREKSTPKMIEEKIIELKKIGFEIIVWLIDDYKADAEWCKALDWSDSDCFILMFDFTRAQGNNKGTEGLKFKWHCDEKKLIKYLGIKNPVYYKKKEYEKGYAIFGNNQSQSLLAR